MPLELTCWDGAEGVGGWAEGQRFLAPVLSNCGNPGHWCQSRCSWSPQCSGNATAWHPGDAGSSPQGKEEYDEEMSQPSAGGTSDGAHLDKGAFCSHITSIHCLVGYSPVEPLQNTCFTPWCSFVLVPFANSAAKNCAPFPANQKVCRFSVIHTTTIWHHWFALPSTSFHKLQSWRVKYVPSLCLIDLHAVHSDSTQT